jgi:hypothetical protein
MPPQWRPLTGLSGCWSLSLESPAFAKVYCCNGRVGNKPVKTDWNPVPAGGEMPSLFKKSSLISLASVALLASLTAGSAYACRATPGPMQRSVIDIPGQRYKIRFQSNADRRIKNEVIMHLTSVAKAVKKDVVITSGFRNCSRNRRARGANKSQHLTGSAADYRVAGYNSASLQRIARQVGAPGAGRYCGRRSSLGHLDLLPRYYSEC